ncbi:Qat anti-phage system QueC-like protein QatC [uncultured Desulfosarcina sp.]|uniref:Qat anti-phage system QueC-like protein QatC n=1 Tax=uncultured Desulfosarcina sp. TaxID=218289 RepID=UPI0029C6CFAC|nr:Qat anti-phage system QueC-like protein QatC [uncultured Desulfosarcina sp.]
MATNLQFVAARGKIAYGIGRAMSHLLRLGLYPTEIGLDILVLAAHVHAADTRISRASESQDGWTREIRLVVPVSDPDRWIPSSSLLVRMLNFLTGDRWSVGFRNRPRDFSSPIPLRPAQLFGPPFNTLSLFSGGLDSLIGAIDRLDIGLVPLFISHASDGATSEAQNNLFDALKQEYTDRDFKRLRLWMSFPDGLVDGSDSESTTRARSFLFFSFGIFAGSGFDDEFTLLAPENGLIALNVPLDPLRLGALSTRTTHPFFTARWNELLTLIGIPGKVENPYWNRTKGEMVAACTNSDLLRRIAPISLSCSSPSKGRWQGLGIQHCGNCLPCLIRRAAFEKGFGPGVDRTTYTLTNLTDRPLNTRQSEGQAVRSFQMTIQRLQDRPELARILIHKPGPLSDESPARQDALAAVFLRGIQEIGSFLEGVRTIPA